MTYFDLSPGQELAIGPDIVLKLLRPKREDPERQRRASIGVACPPHVHVHWEGRAAQARVPVPPPALETMPGATRRPGPPVQRRTPKGE